MAFPLPLLSLSMYHCPSRTKNVLFREDEKIAYRAGYMTSTLFFLINEFLMTCFKCIFVILILFFLPFLPSLPSCLNLTYRSRPVQLLPSPSMKPTTQPPHSELRLPLEGLQPHI